MESSPVKLLPCPFCAGKSFHTEGDHPVEFQTNPLLEQVAAEYGGGWRVCCYGCRVQTWNGLSREEALTTWNCRQGSMEQYTATFPAQTTEVPSGKP